MECKEQYDVIIVGGGAAGICAALKLGENKIKTCILEATDRLCGRAFSEKWTDESWIDYGCEWIHYVDGKKHELIDIAQNEYGIDIFKDILTKENKYKNQKTRDINNWLVYDPEIKQVIPPQLYELCTNDIISFLEDEIMSEQFKSKIANNKKQFPNKDYSIHDILFNKYNQTMVHNMPNILKQCKQVILKQNLNFDHNKLSTNLIQKMIDWSLAWFEDYESLLKEESYYHFFDDEPAYHDAINMQGKFGLFIQMIADKAIKNKNINVKLNKIVKNVQFINDSKMEIILQNGEIHKCKHVIIAINISCLQKRSIKFKPNLCKNIIHEIDNTWGMYKNNKIILQFDTDFAKNNHINKLMLLTKQPVYGLSDSGCITPGMHQKYCMARKKNDKHNNIWVIWLSPRYAQKLYDLYDETDSKEKANIVYDINNTILYDVLAMFKEIFCDVDDAYEKNELPKLKRYHLTNWDKNDFYGGSWCYWKKNGNGIIGCKRIQNLENKNLFDVANNDNCKYNNNLLFAGDWTESGNGTCYDAIKSGRRAAQQIVDNE